MRRSIDRILTTHTGSLPRPPELRHILEGRDQREARAQTDYAPRVKEAVTEAVRNQAQIGLDVITDGEMGRVAFSWYATERLTGFDGPPRSVMQRVEARMFPEFYDSLATPQLGLPACNGPIRWRGPEYIQQDITALRAALEGTAVTEAFMPAVSPGQIWLNFPNDHYSGDEAFVMAAAEALRNEYRAIVDAGFILQLDDPGLAMGWNRAEFADRSIADYRKVVWQHVEAINYALEGIPADRVRLHTCWGNQELPHVRDIPLAEIIDILYRVNAEGLSVEASNPRHAHEWSVFKEHPLPDGKVLLPGVIDSVTNFVEHPDLVAERIVRFADIVGKENVIADTDCGFGTAVRMQPRVHPTIVWAKLQSLVEGAHRASERLWARTAVTA
ncbi:MAG: cobalamin-independent methionine synthase II family protein [Chloroflexi bacterium]|nr:cobalamin-independent methionine synthase II family protein [Chloroflexota bacterium]